jgi:tRNA (adenine37-N6)-methyltransferase
MRDLRIEFKPVGVVRTSLSNDEVKGSWPNGIEAEIEVFEDYVEALDGIDAFSHLIVLFYMHETTEAQRGTLKARPRRFIKYGLRPDDLPLVGVFCLDSPHRPNPIGLTIARLLGRDGSILRVDELDAFNHTPVLDIRPYTPDRCKAQLELPDWFKSVSKYLQERKD